jgi:hypothetical protein
MCRSTSHLMWGVSAEALKMPATAFHKGAGGRHLWLQEWLSGIWTPQTSINQA